jgi:hypothetical protein
METFIHTFQINDKVCDDLIEYHKQEKEYKFEGAAGYGGTVDYNVKQSVDVNFFNSSRDERIRSYFSELQKGYNEYCQKFEIAHLPLSTYEVNMIQYYPPGGGFKVWHWERDRGNDNRQLVYMTYLNDVPNGGTEWKNQNVTLEAKKGLSVIWPADFAWVHRGVVSPTHEKYIATGWFVY